MKKSFLFNGKGGQGIIFTSVILAKSAIESNLFSIQTQHYSAAQRGDVVKSLVLISNEEIYYPKVKEVDFFISFNLKAYEIYKELIGKNTIVIFDSSYEDINNNSIEGNFYKIPFTKISLEKFNLKEPMNLIALGFLSNFLDFINLNSFLLVINKLEKGNKKINIDAFMIGKELKIYSQKGGLNV
ncbi:MAG: 2-oxoacid:acceptor oxidoreductase family protein [Caldisericia bacterium]|nr:2-oxoacid:acceptor oxidoreductase family protein [Caldisericia bacterium]